MQNPEVAEIVQVDLDVDKLEAAMLQHKTIEIETRHYFAPGVYVREVRIPAGTFLTGKIHKTRHISIISKGTITVWSGTGPAVRLSAPYTFVAEPGTRRVGYTHEDTIWSTVHPTEETDLARLEDLFIEPHENSYLKQLPPSEEACPGFP